MMRVPARQLFASVNRECSEKIQSQELRHSFARLVKLAKLHSLLSLLCLLGFSTNLSAQIPSGYYSSASGLTGNAMRNALHNIIDDHTTIPYTSGSFDTHDAINIIQEDPNNSSRIILIYSGYSVAKSSWPDYNREHIWPTSLGPTNGTPAYSDMFNIYGCNAMVNSQRGHKFFAECSGGCSTPSNAPLCRYTSQLWEPRDSEKGDIARALFYLDVRYSGDVAGEINLSLTNIEGDIFSDCGCMGLLDTMIDWHNGDPVDAAEQSRNNIIYSQIQGNRNPFIDHPEWVFEVFGGDPGPDPDPDPEDATLWINEIHYDNENSDSNEGLEIAGSAGFNLAGHEIVLYNGSNDNSYNTIALSGTLPSQQAGYGTLWFFIPGLQNGAPDGIALVDPQGSVIQFLSYEGQMTAGNGPANGMTSEDIGVSESGATLSGESLQLMGSGDSYADFDWAEATTHTRNNKNSQQIFIGAPSGDPEFVRSDCNADSSHDISDPISLLGFLFASDSLQCESACDVNDDGALDIADAVSLLSTLFSGGLPPTLPYPVCGVDPTPDSLSCAQFSSC